MWRRSFTSPAKADPLMSDAETDPQRKRMRVNVQAGHGTARVSIVLWFRPGTEPLRQAFEREMQGKRPRSEGSHLLFFFHRRTSDDQGLKLSLALPRIRDAPGMIPVNWQIGLTSFCHSITANIYRCFALDPSLDLTFKLSHHQPHPYVIPQPES